MKYLVQQIFGIKLSIPTTYLYLDIFVLSFFLVEFTFGNPRPKDKPPPECPRILVCTKNYANTDYGRSEERRVIGVII